jgi:menaquinone-dependent protoporphyrinogen oxidase
MKKNKIFGGVNMNTLIVYASKHGTAEKCALELSQKLLGKVDLCNLKSGKIPEISQYTRIIIGGSIYVGKIQKEVREFCLKDLSQLKQKKVGLFLCCMNKNAFEAQLNSSFPQELISSAVVRENFGGEFKFKEMNFIERAATRMVSKVLSKKNPSITEIDMKKDGSFLFQDNINKFIQLMNNAC